MPELIELNDATLDQVYAGNKPALVLFTNGDGLRGDFRVAFNKMATERADIVFARLDPTKNPLAAEKFSIGEKPVLLAWYGGVEIARRPRPWGTDLPLAVELLLKAKEENPVEMSDNVSDTPNNDQSQNVPVEAEQSAPSVVHDKPVTVTDATFESEVINSDLPVLVDFWAPWCGPCRQVAPALDKLAGEFAGQFKIAKVNVDENPGLSQAFQIRSIPNMMVVKNKTMIFNQPGALPENAIRDLITQAIAADVPTPTAPPAAE